MQSKKILILGGAGFIGTNLTFTLLNGGYDVTILDHPKADFNRFAHCDKKQLTVKPTNFLDFEVVSQIIQEGNFDTVIHLIASVLPVSTFDEFLADSDLNIKATFRLLDEVYKAGIPNFIYFSSGGTVYGNNGLEINKETDLLNPISLYGWYKSAMEQYIHTYTYTHPLNYVILRPSNPYGRYQNVSGRQGFIAVAMGKILKKEPIQIWGNDKRLYLY
jgi:UDP-glucose 4-epimerase